MDLPDPSDAEKTPPMPPLNLEDLETLRTLDETATLLEVSRSTVKRLIASGELAVVHIGAGRGTPRVPQRAILDYVNRRYRQPPRGGKA